VREAFTTAAEVWEYFASETITCLLCGRELKRLAWHLPSIHGVSEEDYRERYGLPLT
jgi:predicted transcriptional regulator